MSPLVYQDPTRPSRQVQLSGERGRAQGRAVSSKTLPGGCSSRFGSEVPKGLSCQEPAGQGHAPGPAAFHWAGPKLLHQFPAGAAPHPSGFAPSTPRTGYPPPSRACPVQGTALPGVPRGAQAQTRGGEVQGAEEGRLPTWGLTPAARQRRLDPGAIKPVHGELRRAAAARASVQTPCSWRAAAQHPQHLLPQALRSFTNSRLSRTPPAARRAHAQETRLLEGRQPTCLGPPKEGGAFMRPPHLSTGRRRRRPPARALRPNPSGAHNFGSPAVFQKAAESAPWSRPGNRRPCRF